LESEFLSQAIFRSFLSVFHVISQSNFHQFIVTSFRLLRLFLALHTLHEWLGSYFVFKSPLSPPDEIIAATGMLELI
jgi:hypothetical protein